MELDEAIYSRRSIRVYIDKEIEDKEIKAILDAGIWAPSGLNNQPWKFKVIKDQKTKKTIANFTKYANIIKNAPVSICVFLDKKTMYDRDKDIMAIGACIQNMLLKAYSLGIGSCWLGEILNKKNEVMKALELKSVYELMAVISLGYFKKEHP